MIGSPRVCDFSPPSGSSRAENGQIVASSGRQFFSNSRTSSYFRSARTRLRTRRTRMGDTAAKEDGEKRWK